MKIRLIIFDLDDTLLHSGIDYNFMKLQIRKLSTQFEDLPKQTPIRELLGILKENSEELFEKANQILEDIETSASKSAQPIDYAITIPELLNKHKLDSAILTNNSRKSVNEYLKNNHFSYLLSFSKIYTRDDTQTLKPDPNGLLQILNDFNYSKEEAVFIGDSIIDYKAAKKIGMNFILFNSRKQDLKLFNPKPPVVISSLNELEEIFDNLVL